MDFDAVIPTYSSFEAGATRRGFWNGGVLTLVVPEPALPMLLLTGVWASLARRQSRARPDAP